MPGVFKLLMLASIVSAAMGPLGLSAKSLGTEGVVYPVLEEDFRIMMMRQVATHNWDEDLADLQDSANGYTKNLPAHFRPLAESTVTRWKDVGVIVTEDIYLPWVDWETGSVFEPESRLAIKAGTYVNPLEGLSSAAVPRLFVFDATDPDQLALAKELIGAKISNLNFMLIAGDLGELSKELNTPIYHPAPTMLEKFHIRAVPTLIGFGRGKHQGHMAITEFKMPSTMAEVLSGWNGLGDPDFPSIEQQSTTTSTGAAGMK